MDAIDQPAWLKIMQNGSVGEARTKAFLLDRFWVLERSVDIDGADFLVQPRGLGSRFTDRSPPKIGVVQAKYFQDAKTVHHIPQSYVLDEHDSPLDGFFAVLHLGAADDARIYMLSASDMKRTLDRTTETPPRFVVGAKALVEGFRVDHHRRQALDRIEHAITSRSVSQSLHFYDRVNIPIYKLTANDIAYRYTLPIPNGQADIPEIYLEYRDHLQSLTYEIEDALKIIDNIMHEPDPRAALIERERLEDYRAGGTWRDGLTFSTRKFDLDWPYLVDALDEHDTRVAALEAIGKLDQFVDLSYAVRAELFRLAADIDPSSAEGQYMWARLKFDTTSLAIGRLKLSLKKTQPGPSAAQVESTRYLHEAKKRRDITAVAHDIWHDLMSKVLFNQCPALLAADDD